MRRAARLSNGTINLKHLIVVSPYWWNPVHRDEKKVRRFLRPKISGTTGSCRLRDPLRNGSGKQNGCIEADLVGWEESATPFARC